MSQRVLLALTQAGVSREDAYRLVQRNAMKVWEQGADFKAELLADPEVTAALSPAEIEEKFDLGYHTKQVDTIFTPRLRPRRRRARMTGRLLLLAFLAAACAAPAGAALPFAVTVTLSPRAAERLAALPEDIIVAASFSGDPTPEGRAHGDEIGRIALGRAEARLPPAAGTVHFAGTEAAAEAIRWVAGPVLLNVNVYSARRSGPDNLLACDFFDGTLASAARAPVTLHCGLIEENPRTEARS